jgi:(+)-trans-carveol dehydrogenase
MGRVDGKVAFITGAARGQGRGHAVRLAEEGADIIALDLGGPVDLVDLPYALAQPGDLAQTVSQVQACGRRAVAIEADVRDGQALTSALDTAVEQFGRLDIVCANAGVGTYAPSDKVSEQSWQDTIDVNLTGIWHTCKAAIPHLVDGGVMILTGSTFSIKGAPNTVHYTASKHGVMGIMHALAHELAPRMIRVNAVLPSMVPTDCLLNDGIYRDFRPELENPTLEDVLPLFKQIMLLPIPWTDVIDISNAVLFLASDEARYITGVALPVDGGTAIK